MEKKTEIEIGTRKSERPNQIGNGIPNGTSLEANVTHCSPIRYAHFSPSCSSLTLIYSYKGNLRRGPSSTKVPLYTQEWELATHTLDQIYGPKSHEQAVSPQGSRVKQNFRREFIRKPSKGVYKRYFLRQK